MTFTGSTPSGCYTVTSSLVSGPIDGAATKTPFIDCPTCLASVTTPTPTTTSSQTPTPTETPTNTPTNSETPTTTPTNTQTPTVTPTCSLATYIQLQLVENNISNTYNFILQTTTFNGEYLWESVEGYQIRWDGTQWIVYGYNPGGILYYNPSTNDVPPDGTWTFVGGSGLCFVVATSSGCGYLPTPTPTQTPTNTETPTQTPTVTNTPSVTPTELTDIYLFEECGNPSNQFRYSNVPGTLNVGDVYLIGGPYFNGYATVITYSAVGTIYPSAGSTFTNQAVCPTPTPTPSVTQTQTQTPSVTPTVTPSGGPCAGPYCFRTTLPSLSAYSGNYVLTGTYGGYDYYVGDGTTIGYVFQNYREALFPWMRTIDNIAYPLKLAGKSKSEVDHRMAELVASFDVKFDLNRFPYELSGGQQQTASIMRALAPKPEVLFLDEPFSALDFEMTLFIREKLQEVFIQTGTTMMLVSHDLEEAVYLADQILLLTKRPTAIADILDYDDPRPRTVATLSEPNFVHTKKMSLEIFQREVRR